VFETFSYSLSMHSGEACHGGCVNPLPSISFGDSQGQHVEDERLVLGRRGAHAS